MVGFGFASQTGTASGVATAALKSSGAQEISFTSGYCVVCLDRVWANALIVKRTTSEQTIRALGRNLRNTIDEGRPLLFRFLLFCIAACEGAPRKAKAS